VKRSLWWLVAFGLWPGWGEASEGELTLPPREAFAIGARTTVSDAAEMDAKEFNRSLRSARGRGEAWTGSFIQVALNFAKTDPRGRSQNVTVETAPQGWEGGMALTWARVTIEDRGYLDDSVAGERWMIWLVPAPDNDGLAVARGLRAWECHRPGRWVYSARPCL
jgi:hypothetical protein